MTENRIQAQRLEYRIKRIDKPHKERLISNYEQLEVFFNADLNCEEYSPLKKEEIDEIIEELRMLQNLPENSYNI